MEVVVLSVAEDEKGANKVEQGYNVESATSCAILRFWGLRGGHTCSGRVLATHVLDGVPGEKTGSFGRRSWASRELLVEGDDFVHARSICGTANGLKCSPSVFLLAPLHSRIFERRSDVARRVQGAGGEVQTAA